MPFSPVIPWLGLLLAAPVELSYRAPSGCPSEARLIEQVEALLQHPLESKVGVRAVSVELDSAPDLFQLHLGFSGGEQDLDRVLEDPDCAALIEAAALIIAIALDPEAMGEVEPPPGRPRPPPIDGLLAPGIPFEIPYPRLGLSVFGGLDLGRGALGADLSVAGAILWSRLRFELQLLWALPRTVLGGELGLYAAQGRACIDLLGLGALELPLCPGLELGALERRVGPAAVQRELWVAATPSLSLVALLTGHLAIRLEAQGLVPLSAPTGPDGTRLSFLGFRGLLGAEVRFP